MFLAPLTLDHGAHLFRFSSTAGNAREDDTILLKSGSSSATTAIFLVHHGSHSYSHVEGPSTFNSAPARWVHLVISADDAVIRIYKDGRRIGANHNSLAEPRNCSRELVFGTFEPKNFNSDGVWSYPTLPEGEFQGTIAYFRIWHNLVVDADQVKMLFLRRKKTWNRNSESESPHLTLLKPRVAVLMFGQTARWRNETPPYSFTCTPEGISHQINATESQKKYLFEALEVYKLLCMSHPF